MKHIICKNRRGEYPSSSFVKVIVGNDDGGGDAVRKIGNASVAGIVVVALI
jgi:hypothetical protein